LQKVASPGAFPADAEEAFPGRVDGDDKEVPVENEGACVEAVDNVVRKLALRARVL
jgi:hypothetical protein